MALLRWCVKVSSVGKSDFSNVDLLLGNLFDLISADCLVYTAINKFFAGFFTASVKRKQSSLSAKSSRASISIFLLKDTHFFANEK